jgi:arsenate reductase (thioredoxin)
VDTRIKMLFVCTGNSARSQMAEGFARHYGAGRVEAHSGGMEPVRLNPNAVAVMGERGIDLSRQQSKAFDEDLARQMDYVITVCGNADERCPVLPPEVRRLHWPLDDPARAEGSSEEILAVFRRSRDNVDALVRGFIAELTRRETGP